MYILTEEGRRYVKEKLPELRLLDMLPASMDAIRNMDDFGVALQWAKKNGWIKIEGNKITASKKPDFYNVQKNIESLAAGRNVTDDEMKILLQRNLVILKKEGIMERAQKLEGLEIGTLSEDLIKTGMWKKVSLKKYNVEIPGEKTYGGKKHPYLAFLDHVKQRMISMGFEEMTGPLVETEFWNMDALYMPQFHSARDIHDAYFIKSPKYAKALDKNILIAVQKAHEKGVEKSKGWEYQYDVQRAHRHILRSQCTALSARMLASKPRIPGKYFTISPCFRYDVIDSTHLPNFYQIEGIVIAEDLNFRHLIGILKDFALEFADTEKIKLVPGYFPFTEPSVEMHAKHPELGWIELGGAGIFRPEMTKPLGIDAPVIAWGLGVDRIGMFKMGIKDIRDLFSTDLNYLRNMKVKY